MLTTLVDPTHKPFFLQEELEVQRECYEIREPSTCPNTVLL